MRDRTKLIMKLVGDQLDEEPESPCPPMDPEMAELLSQLEGTDCILSNSTSDDLSPSPCSSSSSTFHNDKLELKKQGKHNSSLIRKKIDSSGKVDVVSAPNESSDRSKAVIKGIDLICKVSSESPKVDDTVNQLHKSLIVCNEPTVSDTGNQDNALVVCVPPSGSSSSSSSEIDDVEKSETNKRRIYEPFLCREKIGNANSDRLELVATPCEPSKSPADVVQGFELICKIPNEPPIVHETENLFCEPVIILTKEPTISIRGKQDYVALITESGNAESSAIEEKGCCGLINTEPIVFYDAPNNGKEFVSIFSESIAPSSIMYNNLNVFSEESQSIDMVSQQIDLSSCSIVLCNTVDKESNNVVVNSDCMTSDQRSISVKENSPNTGDEEETEDLVPSLTVSSTAESKIRKWDKKWYCIYCGQAFSKIARHWETQHTNENEVLELIALKLGSKERFNHIQLLKNKGNYAHNQIVLTRQQGTLAPKRRPVLGIVADANNYLPCEYCLGFYLRQKLAVHVKNCVHKPKNITCNKNSVRSAAALLPMNESASEVLKINVLAHMRLDEIKKTILKDGLILEYGSLLCNKYAGLPHLNEFISQKMREIARFMIKVKQIHPSIISLIEVFDPKHFNVIIEAVKAVAKFDESKNIFGIPTLTKKIGFTLQKCSKLVKKIAIMRHDSNLRHKIDDFTVLYEMEWNKLSSIAQSNLYQKKWNSTEPAVPSSSDVKILSTYLKEEEKELRVKLGCDINPENWQNLCDITLAHVILFNRRRVGEMQRLSIATYNKRSKHENNLEIEATLSEVEKVLSRGLSRMEIRGKRGKCVPVLLTLQMQDNIDLLIRTREKVGVFVENIYVFAKINSEKSVRGCDVMRKVAIASGAKNPNLLNSTRLRKHVGTMAQIFNLKENELSQLATFMGHTLKTHMDFYRLQDNTLQVAKISKLLINIENGNAHKFIGKTLDEIDLSLEEVNENIQCHTQPTNPTSDHENEVFSENVQNRFKSFNDELTDDSLGPTESGEKTQKTKQNRKRGKNKCIDSDYEPSDDSQSPTDMRIKKTNMKKKKISIKKSWLQAEINAVVTYFSKNIALKKTPNKKECDNCLKNNEVLGGRDWKAIKYYVYNIIMKNKKLS